ncbi:hypothetical protein [Parvibaculum sp.]|uniref:hypothetical protein n=1 Tax=Parvibaculum sp. TaxID=2024848 RepID=UPI002B78F244|nr:hypothetical protein [Parvibaculum sp.]HUD50643.1 hypothetical protein [Parvibaculum sp.]
MALTAAQLSQRPKCHDEIRRHAAALLRALEQFPRLSSVFASEQRGMMANIAFGLYFDPASDLPRRGIVLARFLELVEERGVASRNTADVFIKEMIKYGYLRPFAVEGDRRKRPLEPTETSMASFVTWVVVHLETLDGFDGGARIDTVMRDLDVLSRLQPHIAVDLVGDGGQAKYPETLALFAWVNNSKLFSLRILAGMGDVEPEARRVATDIDSVAELATWMSVSQTHLARKLREAEDLGSIGWSGRRGQSPMWISTGFLKELIDEQSSRLAVFDAAFDAVFAGAA